MTETEDAEMLTTDHVGDYFRRIGQLPLLELDEVADAAKRRVAADAAQQMLAAHAGCACHGSQDGRCLHARRRRRLEQVVADGARARQRLVEHNLKLVPGIARRYRSSGLDLASLIQHGNIGLMRAVDKYDPAMGYRFATYAVWWIRQAVQRGAHTQARTIRVPVNVHEIHFRAKRDAEKLRLVLGRAPDDGELAAELDITVERLREVRAAMASVASLDRPVGDDGSATLGELIVDAQAACPQDEAVASEVPDQVRLVLARLPRRDRYVLTRYFGLDGEDPWTDDQIAEALGVSRQMAYQLRKRGHQRLRHPANRKRLASLVDRA